MKEQAYTQKMLNTLVPLASLRMPRPDAIIGILNGGYVPAVKLQRIFNVPLFWVQISSYDYKKKNKKLKWCGSIIDTAFIKDKNVLIVDDILDSGRTLLYVYHMLNAKSVSAFVLVNKRIAKDMPFHVGYTKVARPEVWVKFPWEE